MADREHERGRERERSFGIAESGNLSLRPFPCWVALRTGTSQCHDVCLAQARSIETKFIKGSKFII